MVLAVVGAKMLAHAWLEAWLGASFNLSGYLANGSDGWSEESGYAGDSQAYPIELPPLVRPQVKVFGDRVLVWTARA